MTTTKPSDIGSRLVATCEVLRSAKNGAWGHKAADDIEGVLAELATLKARIADAPIQDIRWSDEWNCALVAIGRDLSGKRVRLLVEPQSLDDLQQMDHFSFREGT